MAALLTGWDACEDLAEPILRTLVERPPIAVGEEPTVAPGIEAKVLAGAIDEAAKKGHLNRIVRWAPHAAIDAIRVHDFYEEVFVAAGTLLVATPEDCARFEAFAAPAFACRPPHAKHGPFKAGPEGCLLFETQFYC